MSLAQLQLIFKDMTGSLGMRGAGLDEAGCCSLRLNLPGLPLIHLAYAAEEDALVTVAELGPMLSARENELMRLALTKNFLWQGSKGAVFALAPDTGLLQLQRRDPVAELTPARLQKALEAFIEVMSAMCAELHAEKPAQALAEAPAPDEHLRDIHLIRI